MGQELTAIENINPLTVFSGDGLDPVIKQIEDEVRSFVPDMTTELGRKEIASIAYKVARSKTTLDTMGKDLVSGWKKQSKQVDDSRKNMRERLDALKDEVRQPLTDWENADKLRIEKHTGAIDRIEKEGLLVAENWMDYSPDEMSKILTHIQSTDMIGWDEFESKAVAVKDQAIININHGINERKSYDKSLAELAERNAQAQKEREAQIAKDAAENATREAEQKAEQGRIEAEQKAKAERDKIENQRQAAIQAKITAETKAKAEAKQAEINVIAAEKQAEIKRQAAIDEERKRAAAENAAIEQKKESDRKCAEKKAANKAHQKNINHMAMKGFIDRGFSKQDAKSIIIMIAQGQIQNITINY